MLRPDANKHIGMPCQNFLPQLRHIAYHIADFELAAAVIAADDVHRGRADKACNESVGRVMVNNVRRACLLQNAVAHNDDAVGNGHRFNLVMRYVNHGRFVNFVNADKLRPRLLAQLRVKVGERLVQQKVRRLFYQRPAQGNTLLLSAGKVFRLAVFVAL